MTDLSSLAKIVSNFAPTLGAVLPIPGGAAIGNAIAAAFGAKNINDPNLESKIQDDPQAAIKLKEIESQLTLGLSQEETKRFSIQTEDIKNARSHITVWDNLLRVFVTLVVSLITIYILNMLKVQEIQSTEKEIVMFILGANYNNFSTIVNFLFGAALDMMKR